MLALIFPFFPLASLIAKINHHDVNYNCKASKNTLGVFFWILNRIRENNLRNSITLAFIAPAVLSYLLVVFEYLNLCAAVIST
jgi:hypothetical protein